MKKGLSFLFLLFFFIFFHVFTKLYSQTLNLWHAYRGREKEALERIAEAYNLSHEDQISLLAVPFDAYFDKLRVTLPLGNGPDLFIAESSAIASLVSEGSIIPLESYFEAEELDTLEDFARRSVEVFYSGAVWAIPFNVKTLVLFYQKDLIQHPPRTSDALFKLASSFTRSGTRWGFAYELDNFYYHAAWFHAFGGKILKLFDIEGETRGVPCIDSPAFRRSASYVYQKIVKTGIAPKNPERHEITRLFNAKKLLFTMNGQWFRGEIDSRVRYGVALLPRVSELQKVMQPYLTVECYFVSSFSRNQLASVEAIRYLTSPAMLRFLVEAGQTPARASVLENLSDRVFQEEARIAVPIPNVSEMLSVWSTGGALTRILNGEDPNLASKQGQARVSEEIALMRQAGY